MGRRGTVRVLILSLPLAVMAAEGSFSVESGRALVEHHLRQQLDFSSGDWRDVLAGRPVARNVKTDDGREVPVFGAVLVPGEPDDLVRRLRRIEAFETELDVEAVGRFSDPPRLDDLSALQLPEQDLEDIRKCRPGDCELQLPARVMNRFQTQVDWDAPGAADRANALFQELMFDALRAYRTGGVAALSPYADRDPPTTVADEASRLYYPDDTPVPVPELVQYLRLYPRTALAGAEEFFYWNLGDFGMKATARLNHVVIYRLPEARAAATGVDYVIATQQVYANHYFSVTLELRSLVRDDQGAAPGYFLLYATRSHVPGLSGFFGTFLRPIVRGRARSGMENYLQKTSTLLAGQPGGLPSR